MSYSYQAPLSYGPQKYPLTYETEPVNVVQDNNVPAEYNVQQQYPVETHQKGPSSVPAAMTGIGLGAVTGATAGLIRNRKNNPCIVDGNNINDKFALKVYEKYRKKVPDAGVSMKQIDEMLANIGSAKSVDELRDLFTKYPDAAQEACSALGKTPDAYLDSMADGSLRRNKKTLKNKLKEAKNIKIEDIKNDIVTYWNASKKRFEKGTSPDKDLYRAIKRSSFEMKAGALGKITAIGAAIGGAVFFAFHKLLTRKPSVQKFQP